MLEIWCAGPNRPQLAPRSQGLSQAKPAAHLVNVPADQGLTGTKLGCGEGGCGACTVMVSKKGVGPAAVSHMAVNACLCPLYSVEGCHVVTVEGIGNIRDGLHPVQVRTQHMRPCTHASIYTRGWCSRDAFRASSSTIPSATPTSLTVPDRSSCVTFAFPGSLHVPRRSFRQGLRLAMCAQAAPSDMPRSTLRDLCYAPAASVSPDW